METSPHRLRRKQALQSWSWQHRARLIEQTASVLGQYALRTVDLNAHEIRSRDDAGKWYFNCVRVRDTRCQTVARRRLERVRVGHGWRNDVQLIEQQCH